MIGNPFINVKVDAVDGVRELVKRRMRAFIALGGKITLTEWAQLDNETHELLSDIVEEMYGNADQSQDRCVGQS